MVVRDEPVAVHEVGAVRPGVAADRAVATGLVGLLTLLAVLEATAALGLLGWSVGLLCGSLAGAWIRRTASGVLGPADLVTLTRGTLSCSLAGLVAGLVGSRAEPSHPEHLVLVALATLALVLDAVDGRVARATGTTSAFGARFDGEADALLMLVLSVPVAQAAGAWVLAIGLLRYVFGAAGWVIPPLRGQLPPRPWRKVVTAVQGIVLTTALAGVVPAAVAQAALVVALALLLESFGRDVLWLGRRAVT
jgi:phosphatidylglycerophosphate synthase